MWINVNKKSKNDSLCLIDCPSLWVGHYCNTEYLHSRSLVENKILNSLFLNLSLIWSNDLYGGLSENMQSILFSRFLIFFSWKKTIRLLPTSVFWISWTCFHATCFIFVLGFGEKHRKKKRKTKKIIVCIIVVTTISPSILFTGF